MPARLGTIALALLLAAPCARAQNLVLTRIGSGARAAGMANAFVAISDDGTAASWNPGALAQLRKPEFSLVASTLGANLKLDGFRSPDDRFTYGPRHNAYSTTSPEFASLAVPFQLGSKPVTVQLGWRRLYQLHARFDETVSREPTRPEAGALTAMLRRNQRLGGHVDLISLAGSVRATRRLLLGGSLDFVRSGWATTLSLVETPGRSAPSDFGFLTERNRLRGHSGTFGMLLTHRTVNVGLVYHLPFWMRYDIARTIESNLQPPRSQLSEPGTRMRFPTSVAAGLAWRPRSDWTLAADVTRDEWSRTTVDRDPSSPVPTNFFDNLPEDRTGTRDTWTLAVGAERLFRSGEHLVPLRFGFAHEPQGGMDPVTRDPVNVTMLSAGGGFNTNAVKLDVAVQVRWAHYRIAETLSIGNALDGVRDATGVAYQREWRLKLSLIYRVTDTEKLRSLVKRVFVGS